MEGDGSVYPCDFFALDDWKLGNLRQTSLAELSKSERAVDFLRRGLQRPAECGDCRWQRLCFGGCPRDWVADEAGKTGNYYCAAFRQFFAHAEPRLMEIAAAETAARRNAPTF